jgi:hypothetical protein
MATEYVAAQSLLTMSNATTSSDIPLVNMSPMNWELVAPPTPPPSIGSMSPEHIHSEESQDAADHTMSSLPFKKRSLSKLAQVFKINYIYYDFSILLKNHSARIHI